LQDSAIGSWDDTGATIHLAASIGSILIEDLRVLESVRAAAESGRSEFRCGKYDLQPSAQKY